MSKHRPTSHAFQAMKVQNDRQAIETVETVVLSAVEQHGYAKASRFAIKLALEEAIANAFRHGHKNLPPETPITIEYTVDPAEVHIRVQDEGPGFNPGIIPDPTLDENLEQTSGRGVMLIRAYMTKVEFNSRGNRVEMVYKKPGA